ncbi:MAG TPA: putative 2-dehydropantoate 2-reductase [Pirellula sp.]|nr:putative 2-dehydropantoate 2-reductase [Pirellula sp.]
MDRKQLSGMTKFAILGTGALGGFYGGLLARAGFDVHFLMRSDADYVKAHGLRVDSKLGDFHLPQVNVYKDVHAMPKCECIILALKSTQNHILPELLPPLMHDESIVLVLQNGLHVEQETRAVVGPGLVAGGCCFLCSNKVGPGHIRHLDYGKIIMGAYRGLDDTEDGPSMERLMSIQQDMVAAGIDCQATASLTEARWRKLMWNIPFNGLSVILNSRTDRIMQIQVSRELAESIIREVRQTACDCGHFIEPEFVKRMMDHTDEMVPYDSSMRLDFLAGRAIEVEAIFGNALRAANRAKVQSPIVQVLYQQLKFLADQRPALSKKSIMAS